MEEPYFDKETYYDKEMEMGLGLHNLTAVIELRVKAFRQLWCPL